MSKPISDAEIQEMAKLHVYGFLETDELNLVSEIARRKGYFIAGFETAQTLERKRAEILVEILVRIRSSYTPGLGIYDPIREVYAKEARTALEFYSGEK